MAASWEKKNFATDITRTKGGGFAFELQGESLCTPDEKRYVQLDRQWSFDVPSLTKAILMYFDPLITNFEGDKPENGEKISYQHATLSTAVGRSNHSPIKDLELVFSKLIHKLHYIMYYWFFFINRYIIK